MDKKARRIIVVQWVVIGVLLVLLIAVGVYLVNFRTAEYISNMTLWALPGSNR